MYTQTHSQHWANQAPINPSSLSLYLSTARPGLEQKTSARDSRLKQMIINEAILAPLTTHRWADATFTQDSNSVLNRWQFDQWNLFAMRRLVQLYVSLFGFLNPRLQQFNGHRLIRFPILLFQSCMVFGRPAGSAPSVCVSKSFLIRRYLSVPISLALTYSHASWLEAWRLLKLDSNQGVFRVRQVGDFWLWFIIFFAVTLF